MAMFFFVDFLAQYCWNVCECFFCLFVCSNKRIFSYYISFFSCFLLINHHSDVSRALHFYLPNMLYPSNDCVFSTCQNEFHDSFIKKRAGRWSCVVFKLIMTRIIKPNWKQQYNVDIIYDYKRCCNACVYYDRWRERERRRTTN